MTPKQTASIITVTSLTFLLGYCLSGFQIYHKLYKHAYENPAIAQLAERMK